MQPYPANTLGNPGSGLAGFVHARLKACDANRHIGLDAAIHVGDLGRPFDLIRGQRPVLLELDQTIGVDAVALPRLGRAELLMRPAFLDLKPCLKLWVIELGASRAQARFLRLPLLARSEERRVGKGCVSPCRSRW